MLGAGGAVITVPKSRAAAPLPIGFVYGSPVGTAGWSFQHDLGRQAVETAFGARVRTTAVLSTAGGQAAAPAIDTLSRNQALIFATAPDLTSTTTATARQFSRVLYESCTGTTTGHNLGVYATRSYEGRYLAGMVSAAMSRTGHLGHVVPFPTPAVVQGINALALGAQSIDPTVKLRIAWTSSWFDPDSERLAAKALIAEGCDVLSNACGSTAVNEEAEAEGLWNTGSASDMRLVAPGTCLLSVIDDWRAYYVARVRAVLNRHWVADSLWGGIAEGMITISPCNEVVPHHVARRMDARKQAIASGAFSPFQGPIWDRYGALRVTEGSTMTDADLHSMDWLASGVKGHLD